jgi:hypothetical protein
MRERQLAKTVRIFPRDSYGTLPLGHARGSLRTAGVTPVLPRSIRGSFRSEAEAAWAVAAVDR